MSTPGTISAAIVAHNEESLIGRCLDSLQGAVDEIVVVHDGPCGDRTLEIAEQFGCRVFVRPHTANPKFHTVFAYEQCRSEWLLHIDADEYLSEELRREMRSLARRTDVNGYWMRWRMWDGNQYVTQDGPFKLVLFRARATRFLGVMEDWERVAGRVERLTLDLRHEPLPGSTAWGVMWSKWRQRAVIQATQYLTDFSEIPKFNYPGADRWPLRRRVLNLLSPIVFAPYGVATFLVMLARERHYYSAAQNIRFAAQQGIYNAMVMLWVARLKYGKLLRHRPTTDSRIRS